MSDLHRYFVQVGYFGLCRGAEFHLIVGSPGEKNAEVGFDFCEQRGIFRECGVRECGGRTRGGGGRGRFRRRRLCLRCCGECDCENEKKCASEHCLATLPNRFQADFERKPSSLPRFRINHIAVMRNSLILRSTHSSAGSPAISSSSSDISGETARRNWAISIP